MREANAKILILVPSEKTQGGIVNYYLSLKKYLFPEVEYFERGARNWPHRSNFLTELIRAFKDLIRFKRKLKKGNYCLVMANTSLGLFGVVRDAFFIKVANKAGIKSIVFFRGWNKQFERKLERCYLSLFRWAFFRSDAFIVLAESFKRKLIEWGYCSRIFVESTVVDSDQADYLTESELKDKLTDQNNSLNILFLARIKKTKGIFTAIDAYSSLKSRFPKIKLTIAGEGSELGLAKEYVRNRKINDVYFIGKVEGSKKSEIYKAADIYIFPSESEGMPNSVLEAMAFGLPVIASKVGGLADILTDGVTGFFAPNNTSEEFVEHIGNMINNITLKNEISLNNFYLAREKYTAEKVAIRLKEIYSEILSNE